MLPGFFGWLGVSFEQPQLRVLQSCFKVLSVLSALEKSFLPKFFLIMFALFPTSLPSQCSYNCNRKLSTLEIKFLDLFHLFLVMGQKWHWSLWSMTFIRTQIRWVYPRKYWKCSIYGPWHISGAIWRDSKMGTFVL